MSKLSTDTVTEAIAAILKNSAENKRKFVETIELQVALKNYDTTKEKKLAGTVRLPIAPKLKYSVCVIGDAKHLEDAKKANIASMSQDDLKKLKKDKKLVKKLAAQYDAFLASSTLIRLIPRLVGPGLNKAGKFPAGLGSNEDIPSKVAEQKSTIKFQLKSKKALCLGVAVANVSMTPEQINTNLTLAVNFLVSLLSKNWQQVKRLYVKSTMGPSHRIYGF